jgi:hypothetical protein
LDTLEATILVLLLLSALSALAAPLELFPPLRLSVLRISGRLLLLFSFKVALSERGPSPTPRSSVSRS